MPNPDTVRAPGKPASASAGQSAVATPVVDGAGKSSLASAETDDGRPADAVPQLPPSPPCADADSGFGGGSSSGRSDTTSASAGARSRVVRDPSSDQRGDDKAGKTKMAPAAATPAPGASAGVRQVGLAVLAAKKFLSSVGGDQNAGRVVGTRQNPTPVSATTAHHAEPSTNVSSSMLGSDSRTPNAHQGRTPQQEMAPAIQLPHKGENQAQRVQREHRRHLRSASDVMRSLLIRHSASSSDIPQHLSSSGVRGSAGKQTPSSGHVGQTVEEDGELEDERKQFFLGVVRRRPAALHLKLRHNAHQQNNHEHGASSSPQHFWRRSYQEHQQVGRTPPSAPINRYSAIYSAAGVGPQQAGFETMDTGMREGCGGIDNCHLQSQSAPGTAGLQLSELPQTIPADNVSGTPSPGTPTSSLSSSSASKSPAGSSCPSTPSERALAASALRSSYSASAASIVNKRLFVGSGVPRLIPSLPSNASSSFATNRSGAPVTLGERAGNKSKVSLLSSSSSSPSLIPLPSLGDSNNKPRHNSAKQLGSKHASGKAAGEGALLPKRRYASSGGGLDLVKPANCGPSSAPTSRGGGISNLQQLL